MTSEGIPSSSLWELARAGGCARKLPAAVLRAVAPWLDEPGGRFMEDAAVVALGSETVVQSIDFITPLVPDPEDFGRIAAANAMSDIFVAGARPVHALAVACVPLNATEEFARALRAAREHLSSEGCRLIGGHSVIDAEPKLGFAITGTLNQTGRVLGTGAQDGDMLVLTKPIGVGIVSSAFKSGAPVGDAFATAVRLMSSTNSFVPRLLESPLGGAVRSATDVTGFGLVAHVAELSRRSGLRAVIHLASVPLVATTRELAEAGYRTSSFRPNLDYIRDIAGLDLSSLPSADQAILADPQTSGGALMAINKSTTQQVVTLLDEWGVRCWVIGYMTGEKEFQVTQRGP